MTTSSFRTSYLDHAQMTAELRRLVEQHPKHARLQSIGKTTEGRDLWLLAIGKEPDRARPALWIDGNMHAMELTGSSVALSFAEDLLRVHAGESLDLPKQAQEALRDGLVYVLPRMSPDGAEAVLKTGRYVRSIPRDDLQHRQRPRWKIHDVDGDGNAFSMRVRSDSGDFVESKDVAGLMLPRGLDDEGPFYKLFPEGSIDNWDGHTIPTWRYFDDNPVDLNRNFPFFWAPENDQVGAGLFPMSSPEARAVVELTSKQPHLMAWINLHTYGGVCIRPLGDKPDNKMDPGDLGVYRQVEKWFKEHLDYPTVSGFEEFTYEPEKPLRGDVSDYAYCQLGCMSVAVELWDLFARAGIERKKRFVDTYEQQGKDELLKLAKWDQEHNASRTLRPWKRVQHPQLGEVEVGGLDVRVGVWNPPPDVLPDVCARASRVFLRMASLMPRLHVETRSEALGDGTKRVDVIVENRGYLPTHGLWSAAKLALSEPLVVHVEGAVGEQRRTIGHLEGWGHGLFGVPSWPYQASVGASTSQRASFVVKGASHVRVGSPRTGWIEREV